MDAVRADTHPRVLTEVHLKFILNSPDTEMKDLERAVEISQTTYCGASAMFQKSGCKVSWESQIIGK
jgi:putative redox protein